MLADIALECQHVLARGRKDKESLMKAYMKGRCLYERKIFKHIAVPCYCHTPYK